MKELINNLLEFSNKTVRHTSYDINGEPIEPYWSEWTFVRRYINKIDNVEDIHNHIDYWHDLENDEITTELYEFLGLTLDDYKLWLKKPSDLESILEKYKHDHF